MREDSNLVKHAKYEMERIEVEPYIKDIVMQMITTFASGGHSGSSAMFTMMTFDRLANFKALSPLTNNPNEWVEVADDLWQSTRTSSSFSVDHGMTYYDLGERRWFAKWVPWLYRLPLILEYPIHQTIHVLY